MSTIWPSCHRSPVIVAVDHRARVCADPLPVKGRLHETTLAQVELSLAGEEPFAEKHLRALEHVPLHEGALVRDEHVANVIGVREKM